MSNMSTMIRIATDSSEVEKANQNVEKLQDSLGRVVANVAAANATASLLSKALALINYRSTIIAASAAGIASTFKNVSQSAREASDGAEDFRTAIDDVDRMGLLLAAAAIGEIDDQLERNAATRASRLAGMGVMWDELGLAVDNVKTSIVELVTLDPEGITELEGKIERAKNTLNGLKESANASELGISRLASQIEKMEENLESMKGEQTAYDLRTEAWEYEQRLSALGRFMTMAERQEIQSQIAINKIKADLATDPNENYKKALEKRLKLEEERSEKAQLVIAQQQKELNQNLNNEIARMQIQAIADRERRESEALRQSMLEDIELWENRLARGEISEKKLKEALLSINQTYQSDLKQLNDTYDQKRQDDQEKLAREEEARLQRVVDIDNEVERLKVQGIQDSTERELANIAQIETEMVESWSRRLKLGEVTNEQYASAVSAIWTKAERERGQIETAAHEESLRKAEQVATEMSNATSSALSFLNRELSDLYNSVDSLIKALQVIDGLSFLGSGGGIWGIGGGIGAANGMSTYNGGVNVGSLTVTVNGGTERTAKHAQEGVNNALSGIVREQMAHERKYGGLLNPKQLMQTI